MSDKKACFIDFGLVNTVGHHAQSCHFFLKIAASKDFSAISLVHEKCNADIAASLGAHRVLNPYSYETNGSDVKSSTDLFTSKANEALACFRRLSFLSTFSLIYVNSATIPIFRSIIEHCARGGFGNAKIVVEFGHALSEDKHLYSHLVSLHKYLAFRIEALGLKHVVRIAVFSHMMYRIYEPLYGDIIEVYSPLREQITETTLSNPPKTIGFIGHQFNHKGYHLIPDIHACFLPKSNEYEWIIQTSNLSMTATDHRVKSYFDERNECFYVREECWLPRWKQLLEAIDIVVLPYNPKHYSQTYSAIAWECALNRRGVVIPAGTTLEEDLARHNYPFISFREFSAPAISHAIGNAFDFYSDDTVNARISDVADNIRMELRTNSIFRVLAN